MKLHFIYPPLSKDWAGGGFSLAPPLTFGVLAALTPDDVEITITDENLKLVNFQKKYDLVGISIMTSQAKRGYQLADQYRAQGTKVVLGGVHATLMPNEAALHADSVCLGEAEGYWARVVQDFKNGSLKPLYQNDGWPDPLQVPIARRDLFSKKGYLQRNTIQVTRGCPFACRFCSVTRFFGRSYRFRPLEHVLQELSLFAGQTVVFVDDNLVGDKEKAKELFRAMIPLKIKWYSQVSLTIAHDEELLALAAESGCIALHIGFESINQANLRHMRKTFNQVEQFSRDIERIHARGIAILGAFIFGMDEDDNAIFETTLRFAQQNKLELAQFGILTPFPETPLYDELDAQGRIIHYDWSKYGIGDLVIRPKNIAPRYLLAETTRAWKEFYSFKSIIRRVGFFRKNAFALWALNLAHRRLVPKYDLSQYPES